MNIRLACLEGDPVAGVILVVNQDCGALCNDCISPVAHNFDVLVDCENLYPPPPVERKTLQNYGSLTGSWFSAERKLTPSRVAVA